MNGRLCTPHYEEWGALTRVTDKNNNRREHPTGPPYKVILRSDWPMYTHYWTVTCTEITVVELRFHIYTVTLPTPNPPC
jgi:hypothetical protein